MLNCGTGSPQKMILFIIHYDIGGNAKYSKGSYGYFEIKGG
jgi:hypothetical protein